MSMCVHCISLMKAQRWDELRGAEGGDKGNKGFLVSMNGAAPRAARKLLLSQEWCKAAWEQWAAITKTQRRQRLGCQPTSQAFLLEMALKVILEELSKLTSLFKCRRIDGWTERQSMTLNVSSRLHEQGFLCRASRSHLMVTVMWFHVVL